MVSCYIGRYVFYVTIEKKNFTSTFELLITDIEKQPFNGQRECVEILIDFHFVFWHSILKIKNMQLAHGSDPLGTKGPAGTSRKWQCTFSASGAICRARETVNSIRGKTFFFFGQISTIQFFYEFLRLLTTNRTT